MHWCTMQNKIIGYIGYACVQASQTLGKNLDQLLHRLFSLVGIRRTMVLRQNPHFKRSAGSKRGNGHEVIVLSDQADVLLKLLADNITVYTPILIFKI